MLSIPIFPDTDLLHVQHILETPFGFLISLESTAPSADCPICSQPANRVHSRYQRVVKDLPCFGQQSQIHLEIRRFFCDNAACPRKIFAERLPGVAESYARTTRRLHQTQIQLGMALGGEPACRFAQVLGMPCSADTLLRRIRSSSSPSPSDAHVVGVDDWAFRRGQRYGTILCDLEEHRVIDLLPDRSADSLESWLKTQPQVDIISRDRGGGYAKGAKLGAPNAVQVADRWHLLKNAREALQKVIERNLRFVRQAAQSLANQKNSSFVDAIEDLVPPSEANQGSQLVSGKADRREHRLALYQQLIQLHQQKVPLREIARQLQVGRGTVRRYLRAGCFPERAIPIPKSQIGPYRDDLKRRWEEGGTNAVKLWQELKSHGFRGSYDIVRREVAKWRKPTPAKTDSKPQPPLTRSAARPSARRISWMLWQGTEELCEEDQRLVEELKQSPEIVLATELIGEFATIIRQRELDRFKNWLERARAGTAPKDIRGFAQSLQQDQKAVEAAISLEWSNGQVEGQVNRLKTLKRQMYGRAKFDLLRARFLYAA